METAEINELLKKFELKIRLEVSKRLGKTKKGNIFDVEDIVQETMIYLWRLLETRYDPKRASVSTFINSYLVYSIYKAIKFYNSNISYTGKDSSGKRSGTKIIDNSTISLDFNHFDSFSSDQKEVHKHKNPNYHPDKNKIQQMVLSTYGGYIKDEDGILEEMYCEQVIEEVEKRLNEKQLEIFHLLIKDGENTKFTTGRTNPTKYLGANEISEETGNGCRNTINTRLKEIRGIVSQVIKELE